MRVIDLENINTAMRNEEQFVLGCEEVFHDKIGSAAATILKKKKKKPHLMPLWVRKLIYCSSIR